MGMDSVLQLFMETTVVPGISLDERQIIDFVKAKLDVWGFDYTEDSAAGKIGGNSGNLICKVRNGNDAHPALLLAAHVDTITYSSENPVIENDRIVTPDDRILGADDRVGVTILLDILKTIASRKWPHPNLDIVFIVSEEIGLRGSQYLDYHLIDAKTGINFDASARVGQVVVAAPSKMLYEMNFIGKEAHAAVAPEKGVSAIIMAAKTITEIENINRHPQILFNMGTVTGGGHNNVIPGKTKVSGEIRGFDSQIVEEFLGQIQNAGIKISSEMNGNFELKEKYLYSPFQLSDDSLAVKIAREAIDQSGIPFQAIRYRAGSDANIFNEHQIACVNMGLGYANNHSSDEFITINDLNSAVQIGRNIVARAAEIL